MPPIAGFPKASIDAAIARGLGVTASGKPLESVLVEAIVPPSVAVVVDCQTDSKLRTLQELRTIIKDHDGTISPVSYMFTKRGRISFERDERGRTADDLLDDALEAGAEDIEADEDGNIVVSRSVVTQNPSTMDIDRFVAAFVGVGLHRTRANSVGGFSYGKLAWVEDPCFRDSMVSHRRDVSGGRLREDGEKFERLGRRPARRVGRSECLYERSTG